ncbi:hypothetical protein [Deinococcus ruber]|uniref:Uncharacterized protein n=1 Tax=Deinococcus ruber TaxID=1848197 RepID=A0A918FIH0_9DEIO|nr:hypothetical protein [Deinococcus ruber]GGR39597.1 hypothetical protein GCM10008957_55470 [Deinococcus ruber]
MSTYDLHQYRSADAIALSIFSLHQIRVVAAREGKAVVVHDITRTVGSVLTRAQPFGKVWYLEVLKALDLKVPLMPEPDDYCDYAR